MTAGRPRHQPTPETRKMVVALCGVGLPQERIAEVIGVSHPTLRRAYRAELNTGAAKVEGQLVGHLMRLASGNDGTALKAVMFLLQTRFGWSIYNAERREPKGPVLGKKEQLEIAAEQGHADTGWSNLLQ